VEVAFECVDLEWEQYVVIDQEYYRPAEAIPLVGDNSKAKRYLGWKPQVELSALVEKMVKHDVARVTTDAL
jgi:GDPmannose 4,6-dehydratase